MSTVKQSAERLEIIRKIKEYELNGWFDKDVEDDPETVTLLKEDVDYLNKKIRNKLMRKYTFWFAKRFLKKLEKKKLFKINAINGLENYNLMKDGGVITCNHFSAMDSFVMEKAFKASSFNKKRTFYRVIREGNYTAFKGFFGLLMRYCNTLPLSSNMDTMKVFNKSISELFDNKDFLLIYPEEGMWWNYRKPRPFKLGGYKLAIKHEKDILPCFITMNDGEAYDDNGFIAQEYTVHIGKPISSKALPGESRCQTAERIKNENFAFCKKIYEETYNVKLSYTCDEKKEDADLQKKTNNSILENINQISNMKTYIDESSKSKIQENI
ncbi:MAG: lysophospholipid acyltransferase family protein [Anaeroplasmataceae bacterium]